MELFFPQSSLLIVMLPIIPVQPSIISNLIHTIVEMQRAIVSRAAHLLRRLEITAAVNAVPRMAPVIENVPVVGLFRPIRIRHCARVGLNNAHVERASPARTAGCLAEDLAVHVVCVLRRVDASADHATPREELFPRLERAERRQTDDALVR